MEAIDRLLTGLGYTLGRSDNNEGPGVKYYAPQFEGAEKWHCGCSSPPFGIYPVQEDIPHYLKLVELGNKRVKMP